MNSVREEADMIRDIKAWPRWPWLPIKRRYDNGWELSVVYADDIDGPVRVFDINLLQVSMEGAVALTRGQQPYPVKVTYADVDALVADGWMGD